MFYLGQKYHNFHFAKRLKIFDILHATLIVHKQIQEIHTEQNRKSSIAIALCFTSTKQKDNIQ